MTLEKYFPNTSFTYTSYEDSSPNFSLKIIHNPTGESVQFNKDDIDIKGHCYVREYLKMKLMVLVIEKYGLNLKY